METAARDALVSGAAGASAMACQVLLLMPMDTTITMQYRYGSTTMGALRSLWSHGYGRFYAGIVPALMQGPLSRFGDTCSNAFVLAALHGTDWPMIAKTTIGSAIAALWRVLLMPIDVCKTVSQIYGKAAPAKLVERAHHYGFAGFYFGSWASFSSAFCGHLPWYTTFNLLDAHLPQADSDLTRLLRPGLCGFAGSVASDTSTNAIKVLKAIRQAEGLSYADALAVVLRQHGVVGLVTRSAEIKFIFRYSATSFCIF